MSYDLMVFEETVAPRERGDFLEWFQAQTEWPESHNYSDPVVTSPCLQEWYAAITAEYPNMNGPDISDDDLSNAKLSDYSIGKDVIYAAFAWSEAEEAYPLVRQLAVKHKVGFYDVSGDEGDGEIYFPSDQLRDPSGGAWRQISSEFQVSQQSNDTVKGSFFDFFRRKK
ncbi:hypothetical protein [Sphingorhabdus sp. Alg231-15]|uniref:hypothetical protein n=1 Tax=Sphingorhabdus sp. Alg231-15 TaxID=1922222 RepID=UPI00307B4AC2